MPDETPPSHTQINQICDRFEDAWRQNAPVDIADFLAMATAADRQRLLEQLLPIDIEFRQKTNATCDPDIYTVLGPEAVELAADILGKNKLAADQATMAPRSGDASSADLDDSDLDFDVAFEATRSAAGSTASADSKRIGRYKLLQEIGEGGMGTVWMAEQQQPVRRRVALKVIKTGMDTKQVIARFEAERQALALMDHQNIARVLDAGTTDEGLPYFVMELVKGIPYVEYCNKNRLSIKERLELFVPVCKAIQHAHQKGIIHRDLKPSNVLVTLYDGHAVPKVIDFGLAKALDQQAKLTDRTMFTEFGQVVGTLQYMSPEQAEMNALDVDTRTDVYSLGVMLYELLTGTTPIETKTLKQNALMKVLEVIRETDPPRPSIRLSESGDAVSGYSEQRKIEPARLQQMLRGELDWIVMKSLEKDRTRRYETASAFVDDIQRYLADEAVEARPATARYLFGKFVKKHRGLVATIAALTGLLIAGIIGTSYGLVQANRKTAEVVEQKQRADGEAENARAAEKVAKQKEAEAATEASKSQAAEKTAKQKEAEAAMEASKAKAAEARAKQNEQQAISAKEQTEQTLARSNFFLATARWSAGRIQDSHEFLSKIPRAYRNVECGLLRQLEGCEMTCYGHSFAVNRVRYTADRSRIVSSSNKIKIWDATTGKELREIDGQQFDLNFTGTQIAASTSDHKIKLFDLLTGEELKTLPNEVAKSVSGLRFSNNSKQLAAIVDHQTIKLWDPTNGQLLHTISSDKQRFLKDTCFSPDGKWIAILGGVSVTLWDTNDGKLLRSFDVHDLYGTTSLCVSPDGRWIATGGKDQTIKLWDAATGKEVRTYTGHADIVECVCFSPDGLQIASGSDNGTIKLWDTESGQQILTHRGHTAGVTSVTFSPDGTRIVSGSKDATVKFWNATAANNFRLLRGHFADISHICFSQDGKRIASASLAGAPKIWDAITGEAICSMKAGSFKSYRVAFNHDGTQLVSGQFDGTIRLWDASNGDELLTILAHPGQGVTSVGISPDNKLIVSTGLQGTLKLWDAETGQEIRAWKFDKKAIDTKALKARFSPDGKQIFITYVTGVIRTWDVGSGEELQSPFPNLDLSAVSPCFEISADGTRIATGTVNSMIKIWDKAGKLVNTLRGHKKPIRSLSLSPDGKRLVSITGLTLPLTDHTVKLWDVVTGEELISFDGQSLNGSNILFSPDGSMIAWAGSGANPVIKLWDVATGEEVKQVIKGMGSQRPRVTTSDDGMKVTLSFGMKEIVVFDANSNELGITPGGSLPQFISSGADLLVVDPDFRDSRKEKIFRQFKAKLVPSYHAAQALIALQKEDWYVATFHRAWELKADPNSKTAYDNFQNVYKALQVQYDDQKQELTDFLSPQVVEAAGLSAPKSPKSTFSKLEAKEINRDIWEKVKSPNPNAVKNGVALLSQTEIDSMRDVCNDFRSKDDHIANHTKYLKTLLLAEYRLNHLDSVMSVDRRLEDFKRKQAYSKEKTNDEPLTVEDIRKRRANIKREDLDWSPVELAVLAMSYHKLSKNKKATEFQAQLDQAMKLDKCRDDEDSKSFFAEANELLGPPTPVETDE